MTYDKNGNIVTLNRNGVYDDPVYEFEMDNLTYTYSTNNPNQLMKVSDSTNNPNGFRDGTNTDDDYSYDDNGNMLTDKNKEIIANIKYNHLNLPTKIEIGANEIIYLYTATGQKLRKEVRIGSETITTDYLDGFQYINGNLEFFPTAEGYVKYTRIEGNEYYNYVYNYTDHLGNIRLSYGWDNNDNVLKILEENHYYTFGLKHDNYNIDKKQFIGYKPNETPIAIGTIIGDCGDCTYKYKYNGKEYQDELGLNMYDYGARNYDPAIGRWMNIDNMSEKYHHSSPYVYANNNPVIYVDLDGNEWFYYSKDGKSDPTWNWHDGNTYDTKVKDSNGKNVVLTGVEAVVVFNGSRDEKLGTKNGKDGYIDGKGAVIADVTVYGPDGADDVHTFKGYTMSSDPVKFGAIDEGTYDGNYDKIGKTGALKSNWAINGRGRVRTLDGEVNPFVPSQIDGKGDGYKTGIFIHRPNNNGYAGATNNGTNGISVGCLLISPSDWNEFNKVMSGVKNFKVQVHRTVTNGKTTTVKKD